MAWDDDLVSRPRANTPARRTPGPPTYIKRGSTKHLEWNSPEILAAASATGQSPASLVGKYNALADYGHGAEFNAQFHNWITRQNEWRVSRGLEPHTPEETARLAEQTLAVILRRALYG